MNRREEQVQHSLERAHEDTFDWVLNHPGDKSSDPNLDMTKASFCKWLHGTGRLFWVCGKAASGKSTLMRKICRDSRLQHHLSQWAPQGTVTVAKMFFTTEGTELQRSQEGLLRSLLHQALVEPMLAMQVLGPHLNKTPDHTGEPVQRISWTLAELCTALHDLLRLASTKQRFCFFVDGLDEYNVLTTTKAQPPELYLETDNQQGRKIRAGHREIAKLLLSAADNDHVKICVSSRPSNEIHAVFSHFPTFKLENLTKKDMETFVRAQVLSCVDGATAAAEYEDCAQAIVASASGVFLWVNIVTDILVDGIVNGVDPFQLRVMLDDLPTELGGSNGLYMRMLQRLDQEQRAKAWDMFDIVLHARRDLTPLFLSFAVTANPRSAIAMTVNNSSDEELEARSDKIRRRVRALGNLLEIQDNKHLPDGHIRFIHLSVREFLLRVDVQRKLTANSASSTTDANVSLLSACLIEIKSVECSFDMHETKPWKTVKDALYYAAEAACSTGLPQTDLLVNLDKTIESICLVDDVANAGHALQESHRPHWQDREPRIQALHSWRSDFTSLAVQANLTIYLQQKLQDGYRITDKPGRPLLSYAVLPQAPVRTDVPGLDTFGTDYSNESMIGLLLSHSADPNAVYDAELWTVGRRVGGPIWPSPPSIWQLVLAEGLGHVTEAKSWEKVVGSLLAHGASPNATAWTEDEGIVDSDGKSHQYSALFVSLYASMTKLDCDTYLPKALLSKGGNLRRGELEGLGKWIRGGGNRRLYEYHLFPKRYAFLRSCFPGLVLSPEGDLQSDWKPWIPNLADLSKQLLHLVRE
jgi:hypothetical protein